MAPSLPSCISDTFFSHRQASWFLLATLSPFFLPFLILCVPFLLLFLAPVSVFLFSLLLLYKVQVSIRPKLKLSHRRADKDVVNEGYQPTQRIATAERLDIHPQAPLEEDTEFKGLEVHVQSAERHTHHKGDGVCDFEEEKHGHSEEDLAAQDHTSEDKLQEMQEEQDIEEAPLVEEGREGRSPEGAEVSHVQNVELAASSKAQVGEGLQSTERESNVTEETQEDKGKESLQNDMMEDNKQEEEEVTEELSEFKDEQKHPPQYLDVTSSRTSEENRPSPPTTYEGESLDMPFSYEHRSSVPFKLQGQESLEDRNERLESSHMHPFEEARSNLPAIQVTEPYFQSTMSVLPDKIVEKPGEEELKEQFEIDTALMEIVTHERIREEPEVSSKQDSSLEILDDKGRMNKKEDIFFPAEPFEKETEEGEPSYSSPEGHGQWRTEAFSKETRDDEHPQNGGPAKSLAPSFETESSTEREEGYLFEATSSAGPLPHVCHGGIETESSTEREEGYPFKATSSAVPLPHVCHGGIETESSTEREEGYPFEATSSAVLLPHVCHGGIEFQDKIQEEQKIMADINAIKKIVGYEGGPHESLLDQISALYMFLGMEPYSWGAEVDNLERAQAEIELLKVVVGVK